MKILLALDARPASEKLVREALNRPWPAGSSFLLVHVVDPLPFVKAPISIVPIRNAAHSELERLSKLLTAAGWSAETDVTVNNPRHAIADLAGSWSADLVMIGSRDPSPLTRLLLGSTARSVLRQAACSVEVVRFPINGTGPQGGGMHVLVATDGSEFSLAALCSVANRPWPSGSEMRVISVPELFLMPALVPYVDLKEIEELNSSFREKAAEFANAGSRTLSTLNAKVSAVTPSPSVSPANAILDEAQKWGAQMIVLGSHGRRGFDRWAMGSVSEHVAFHAHCSVEVIRDRKAQMEKRQEGERQ